MNIRKTRFQFSPPQTLAIGLIGIILAGTLLLSLPVASSADPLPLIDALFTSTSAVSVTGLVVTDTGHQFSLFGEIVLAGLIQVGGLGFMTMATWIALMFRKRISYRERLVLKDTLNEMSLEGIIRLIRKALLFSLFIEGAGAVLLALRWSAEMPFAQAVYMGVWHAISFFNNAGFDLLGPYGGMTMYTEDLIVNLTAMGLILLGGIGFIVMVDLAEYRRRKHLSLHSKVVLSMTALLTLSGAVVLFIFEFTNEQTMGPLDGAGKVLASFFHCVSRTSGTTTLDIGSMRQASQFFLILVMFIGASPGSVGGGIKTTTFAILLGAMLSIIRGKKDVVLFRHRVPERQVFKAITLTLFAFTIVLAATMILSITERYPILEILFEVTSAFATVGMTTGLTPDLTVFGKIVIIITMFIGRLGPLTLAYALGSNAKPELYRHPEGKIMIG